MIDINFCHICLMGKGFQIRHLQQIFHSLGHLSKPVDQLILHIHVFFLIFNRRDPFVDIQLLILILNISRRNIGIDIAVHHRLEILFLDPLAFKGLYRLVQQFAVQIIPYGFHMAVLLRSQHVACPPDL